ncbi:hypothetical protein H5410_048810 [Solanum commersonii]|uniref:Uncharacterized protein n=1 Tax=Solanum commersonii TaxID=4109 RepID=A0A9J5XMT7_SOLCO|nr:hypothetical protein H5410_048810 [Solanum commersonii]
MMLFSKEDPVIVEVVQGGSRRYGGDCGYGSGGGRYGRGGDGYGGGVEEEVGVTSVEKMVISQGNVSKVVDMAAVVMGDMAARQWKRKWWE